MGKNHKHKYGVISVKRHPTKRGYVIVRYMCSNRETYCDKPYKDKTELEKS